MPVPIPSLDSPSAQLGLRHLLRLLVLLAAAGFLAPVETEQHGREGSAVRRQQGTCAAQGHPRVDACILGGGVGLVAEPDPSRSRGAGRSSPPGTSADLARVASTACPAPRSSGMADPLAPGESAPGQYFLRVNGSANAHGARS